MNWRRFKHQCHEAARLLDKGETIGPALEKAKISPLLKELGPESKKDSLQASLLASLENGNYSENEAKSALKIYAELDVSELAHKPNRIRRVGIYLLYLATLFFVIGCIYLLYVVPTTLSFYEAMHTPLSSDFVWFVNNWYLIFIAVLSLFVLVFLVTRKVKHLFDYRDDVIGTGIYRWILPGKLRSSHERLISLIRLPLQCVKNGSEDPVAQYYRSEKYIEKEVAESLSMLMGEALGESVLRAESYLRRIYVVIAILIILSIAEFVSSAYGSLFSIGEFL